VYFLFGEISHEPNYFAGVLQVLTFFFQIGRTPPPYLCNHSPTIQPLTPPPHLQYPCCSQATWRHSAQPSHSSLKPSPS
jgi:hypothetical protein